MDRNADGREETQYRHPTPGRELKVRGSGTVGVTESLLHGGPIESTSIVRV